MISNKRTATILLAILALFLILRIPGVHIPLHQDEGKWASIVNSTAVSEEGRVPHPPLGEFIYRGFNTAIGNENLRLAPVIFGLLNILLLFYLIKMVFDRKTALWVTGLFAVSAFSVLASLMVDTDGEIMPFFFLVMAVAYYKLKGLVFVENKSKVLSWLAVFIVFSLLGFLVKVSFGLYIVAFALDFVIENRMFSSKKQVYRLLLLIVGGCLALVGVLFLSKLIFPSFRIEYSLQYWEHFANLKNRQWLQTVIQFIKSILYSSPLLLTPLLFLDKEVFKKSKAFSILIFLSLFAYLIAFDFSIGALDRYLQFLVAPLCIITGLIFAKYIDRIRLKEVIVPGLIAIGIFALQFINPSVPSLYPKTEWIRAAISFKWNFLFPFMGGSGPLPFYVSFMFLALLWIACLLSLLFALKNVEWRRPVLIGILIFGILYNVVLVEEYLFGGINGNTAILIKESTDFIKQNPDIQKVTVYNDNGGYEVQQAGKYRKRLYVDPKFDINEKIKTLNEYKEHYLVIDIPHLDPTTVYAKYFSTCESIYYQKSGVITANVYDCSKAQNIILNK